MTALIAGLFGKMPAHGDFVERGWPADVVAALDAWLTAAIAAERVGRDDDAFAARLSGAPLWQGYLPPGSAGPLALHVALAPSIDRAGRFFMLAAGYAGPAEDVWAQASQKPGTRDRLERAIYDALANRLDADLMLGTIAGAMNQPTPVDLLLAGIALPHESAWWIETPAAGDPALVRSPRADTALLAHLLDGGHA